MLAIYTIALFCAGVMTWSFSEYALHDWHGHRGKGKNKFSREHLAHHAKKDYFAPTVEKIAASTMVFLPLGSIAVYLGGWYYGLTYTLGLGLGYFAYEIMHRRVHTHAPRNGYGRWARKHHFHHHFGSAKTNHGVTSPIWDIVFGTFHKVDVVPVPEKMAMDWLLDDDGEVKEEYASDYKLIKRKKKVAV